MDLDGLPRGLLVGVVEIVGCKRVSPADSAQAGFQIPADAELYGWELASPRRLKDPSKPQRQPQPSFFFVE